MFPRIFAVTALTALVLVPPPGSPAFPPRPIVNDLLGSATAAEDVQLSGIVVLDSARSASAAEVSIVGGGYGALTDAQGRYTILLGDAWAGREVTVRVQLTGYDEARRTLTLSSGTNRLDFALER